MVKYQLLKQTAADNDGGAQETRSTPVHRWVPYTLSLLLLGSLFLNLSPLLGLRWLPMTKGPSKTPYGNPMLLFFSLLYSNISLQPI